MHREACLSPRQPTAFIFGITSKGRHAHFLHVVSPEQSILHNAGNTSIARFGPLSEMSAVPSQYFSGWNHQRGKSDECQQKDDLPMDRERTRDHVSNSERPTTDLLQLAIQRR